jgi:hypothetical protein
MASMEEYANLGWCMQKYKQAQNEVQPELVYEDPIHTFCKGIVKELCNLYKSLETPCE